LPDALHAQKAPFKPTMSPDVHRTVSVTEGTNMSATVSPDGRTVIFDLQEELWSLPMGGGTAKRLTDPMVEPARPDWSPKGDLVAFQGYRGGNFHVWVMRPDGTGIRQLTTGLGDDREPRFSPDGKTIAFSSDRAFEGSYDIWTVDVATGRLARRTQSADEEFEPTWDPDGKRIAYVSGVGVLRGHTSVVNGLKIETVDDRGAIATAYTLPAGGDAHLDSPAYSPDGTQIAFTRFRAGKSELMVGDRKVGAADDVFPFYPSWISPHELLYTGNGKLLITDVATDETRVLPFSASFRIDRPSYAFRRHDFDSTAAAPVQGILHPTLSPDAKEVVFMALNQLWRMRIGGKPEALTSDNFYKESPAYSPDGKRLAYTADNTGAECMYVMDLATKVSHRVTRQRTSAELAPAWSPDGTRLAFHDQDGVMMVAEIATGATHKVADETYMPGQPSWFRDGNTLAFTALHGYSKRFREGNNQIETVDLKTGVATMTEPAPMGSIRTRAYNGPVYAPDGSAMVFGMGDRLYLRPVDARGVPTGKARMISDEVADAPTWSGDSKQVLYLSNGRLRLLALDRPAQVKTIPIDLTYRLSVPQGRVVIHAGTVWSGLDAGVQHDVDITVDGNRITAMAPHRDAQHAGARVIDAGGMTVMPGMWESHTHNYGGVGEAGDTGGRLWLAYGFTTLQGQGDEAYTYAEARESFAAGARVGPRYFGATELVAGNRVFYPVDHEMHTAAELQREFERGLAFHADNYKTYATLEHAWQKDVTANAHARAGAFVASHYGPPSLLFGVDGMSHVSATSRWGYTYTRSAAGKSYGDVMTLFPAAKMWVISTAFASTTLFTDDPKSADDVRLKTMNVPWAQRALEATRDRTLKTDQTQVALGLRREDEIVQELIRRGDLAFPGMDSSTAGQQLPLQLSLRALVKYGMQPWQALQTMTLFPARAYGYERDLGTLEVGKLADLIVVDGKPLEKIEDATRIHGAMVNGRYNTVDELMAPFAMKR
jgi:Tol biopolymer transport system component